MISVSHLILKASCYFFFLDFALLAGLALALYVGAGALFTAHTPQVLPPAQYLHLLQFLQAVQLEEPTHLPRLEQQLSGSGNNIEIISKSFII